jgi:hypothetical protein
MFFFVSAGPWGSHTGTNSVPGGSSFENATRIAPCVRTGQDTADSWQGMNTGINGQTTRSIAPVVQAHHFGDITSLMVGTVHALRGGGPGPD